MRRRIWPSSVLITREIPMSSFRQARGAGSSLEAGMMSTFELGQMLVRRSGSGAMQLAGPYAFGPPPDRASAIGVLRAAVAAGVDHIDTAQYYGPGVVNDLIREALHPYFRHVLGPPTSSLLAYVASKGALLGVMRT